MAIVNIALAQINCLVGDILGNCDKIIATAQAAWRDQAADIVIFPELTLTGYPPEDLLLRPSLEKRISVALNKLAASDLPCCVVLGYPKRVAGQLYNMAGVVAQGELVCEYAKQCLPNYRVFDEKRYFAAGDDTAKTFVHKGVKFGLTVCEDIWDGSPVAQLTPENIDVLINISASPYHLNKQAEREALVKMRARDLGAGIVFVNWVGGQDELIFDGGSVACDKDGDILSRGPLLEECTSLVAFNLEARSLVPLANQVTPLEDNQLAVVYKALVLGVRDYVNKNGFKGVILGLSGGIDSALTLAIACDAIGAARVEALMMPFTFTSEMSKDDAQAQAEALGVTYHSIGIEPIYKAFVDSLAPVFKDAPVDTTEENIQARSRGVMLMALSNKWGYLVLTTGNKSEMSVGYATLYGDMAGGLDVLKDVPKTMVFALARYRNTLSEVIPERVITRPPSAELAPDQKDEDSLPPYDILDSILALYIEDDCSCQDIVAQGFDEEQVKKVIRLVDVNEYKRRQAPVGIRISQRAFGRDRRYPITNGWHIGD